MSATKLAGISPVKLQSCKSSLATSTRADASPGSVNPLFTASFTSTPSAFIRMTDAGSSPSSKLACKCSNVSFPRFPNEAGTPSFSLFPCKSSSSRFERSPKDAGISSVSEQHERSSCTTSFRKLMSDGNVKPLFLSSLTSTPPTLISRMELGNSPPSLLSWRCRRLRFSRCPHAAGMSPVSRFPHNSRVFKFFKSPSAAGNVPVSLFCCKHNRSNF